MRQAIQHRLTNSIHQHDDRARVANTSNIPIHMNQCCIIGVVTCTHARNPYISTANIESTVPTTVSSRSVVHDHCVDVIRFVVRFPTADAGLDRADAIAGNVGEQLIEREIDRQDVQRPHERPAAPLAPFEHRLDDRLTHGVLASRVVSYPPRAIVLGHPRIDQVVVAETSRCHLHHHQHST